MRIRMLKPGFFQNEDLAECSDAARLTFAGLWLLADREGRLEDRPKRIKAELFPYTSPDVDSLLAELERWKFIIRYDVAGQRYIAIPNFSKHQRPHAKEVQSAIPAPSEDGSSELSTDPGECEHLPRLLLARPDTVTGTSTRDADPGPVPETHTHERDQGRESEGRDDRGSHGPPTVQDGRLDAGQVCVPKDGRTKATALRAPSAPPKSGDGEEVEFVALARTKGVAAEEARAILANLRLKGRGREDWSPSLTYVAEGAGRVVPLVRAS